MNTLEEQWDYFSSEVMEEASSIVDPELIFYAGAMGVYKIMDGAVAEGASDEVLDHLLTTVREELINYSRAREEEIRSAIMRSVDMHSEETSGESH